MKLLSILLLICATAIVDADQHDICSVLPGYYIQVKAVVANTNSDKILMPLISTVLQKGYKLSIHDTKVDNVMWRKILLGPYSSKMVANRNIKIIRQQIAVDAFVYQVTHSNPPNRYRYKAYDLMSAKWQSGFAKIYRQALASKASWIKNPHTIALRISGYPNEDNTQPEKIEMIQTKGKSVFIISSGNLRDDSVSNIQTRIDLIQHGQIWKVAWVGERWRCYRSQVFDWGTVLCP